MAKRRLSKDLNDLIEQIGEALEEVDKHASTISKSIRERNEMFEIADAPDSPEIGGRSLLAEQTIGNLNNQAYNAITGVQKNKIELLKLYKATLDVSATETAKSGELNKEDDLDLVVLKELDMQLIKAQAEQTRKDRNAK